MALHLPTGPLNPALSWSQYQDANLAPTSPLADDLATEPLGPVTGRKEIFYLTMHSTHFIYGYMASDIW